MKFEKESVFKPKNIFFISAVFYLLICLGSALLGWRNPDCEWFVENASQLFTVSPYSYQRVVDIAPPLGQGFCCTPLLLFLIAPFAFLGQKFGFSNQVIANLYPVPLHLIDILNIYLTVKIIREYRKISRFNLNLIILVLFFSGYFLFASGFLGHPETLVLLFSLLGIRFLRKEKLLASGALFGLALSAKQSAIFILMPIFFYLLFEKDGLRRAFRFGIGATLLFLLVVFPFFITHPIETWYGLFGVHQRLIIHGSTIWWFLGSFASRALNLNWVDQVIIKIANPVLFVLAFLFSVFFVRRRRMSLNDSSLFGLISVLLLLLVIFSKWLEFHYFLLPFVFIILWDSIRSRDGFPVFGVTYAFLLFVAHFSGHPLWQFFILMVNFGCFGYLVYALAESKGS